MERKDNDAVGVGEIGIVWRVFFLVGLLAGMGVSGFSILDLLSTSQ